MINEHPSRSCADCPPVEVTAWRSLPEAARQTTIALNQLGVIVALHDAIVRQLRLERDARLVLIGVGVLVIVIVVLVSR